MVAASATGSPQKVSENRWKDQPNRGNNGNKWPKTTTKSTEIRLSLWGKAGVKQKLILLLPLLLLPLWSLLIPLVLLIMLPILVLLAKGLTTEIHCHTPQHVAKARVQKEEEGTEAKANKKLYTKLGSAKVATEGIPYFEINIFSCITNISPYLIDNSSWIKYKFYKFQNKNKIKSICTKDKILF